MERTAHIISDTDVGTKILIIDKDLLIFIGYLIEKKISDDIAIFKVIIFHCRILRRNW